MKGSAPFRYFQRGERDGRHERHPQAEKKKEEQWYERCPQIAQQEAVRNSEAAAPFFEAQALDAAFRGAGGQRRFHSQLSGGTPAC
jgi:hypothetical protein